MYCVFLCFFFFKQKTAYEMRISDWSSDVCSSDLFGLGHFSLQNQFTASRPVRRSSSASSRSRRHGHERIFLLCGLKNSPRQSNPAHAEWTHPSKRSLPEHSGPSIHEENGRASCRERGCTYVLISVVAVSINKKQQEYSSVKLTT